MYVKATNGNIYKAREQGRLPSDTPVVVIPLAQWQRLAFLMNDEITYGTDNVQEILDIIASVEVE